MQVNPNTASSRIEYHRSTLTPLNNLIDHFKNQAPSTKIAVANMARIIGTANAHPTATDINISQDKIKTWLQNLVGQHGNSVNNYDAIAKDIINIANDSQPDQINTLAQGLDLPQDCLLNYNDIITALQKDLSLDNKIIHDYLSVFNKQYTDDNQSHPSSSSFKHDNVYFQMNGNDKVIKDASAPYRVSWSGDPHLNLNCRITDADGEKITCSNLASQYVLDALLNRHGKVNLRNFASADSIKTHTSRADKLFEKLHSSYDERHLIATAQLGTVLEKQAQSMEVGQHCAMLLASGSHVMAIRLRVKGRTQQASYVVNFYDPNHTDSHVRLTVKNSAALSALQVKDFMSSRCFQHYFPDGDPHPCLIHAFKDPNLSRSETVSDPLDYRINITHAESMYHLLQAGCATDLAQAIPSIMDMNNPMRSEILGAKNIHGVSGLYMALQNGHKEVITVYMTAILNADLSTAETIQNLAPKNPDGIPGLFMALQQNHGEAAKAYAIAILNSKLTEEDKVNLLVAKDPDGNTGLSMAMRHDHSKAVDNFLSAILDSDKLKSEQKFEIISAKIASGISAAVVAMYKQLESVVTTYITAILHANLPEDKKVELILAKYSKEQSALALTEGKLAHALKVIISQSRLKDESKKILLEQLEH